MEGKEGNDSAAATKRKREALGEVTGANGKGKAPLVANPKGKSAAPTSKVDKKPDSVVLKAKVTASTTVVGASSSSTAATHPPVRVFGAAAPRRSTRSTVTEDAKFVVAQDERLDDVPGVPEEEVIVCKSDGMEVDLLVAAAARHTSALPLQNLVHHVRYAVLYRRLRMWRMTLRTIGSTRSAALRQRLASSSVNRSRKSSTTPRRPNVLVNAKSWFSVLWRPIPTSTAFSNVHHLLPPPSPGFNSQAQPHGHIVSDASSPYSH
jgi:hypothetical protein